MRVVKEDSGDDKGGDGGGGEESESAVVVVEEEIGEVLGRGGMSGGWGWGAVGGVFSSVRRQLVKDSDRVMSDTILEGRLRIGRQRILTPNKLACYFPLPLKSTWVGGRAG